MFRATLALSCNQQPNNAEPERKNSSSLRSKELGDSCTHTELLAQLSLQILVFYLLVKA